MIFRSRVSLAALILGLLLAGCATDAPEPNLRDKALAALSAGDGIAAEAALREALAEGAPRELLAPYMGEAEMLQGNLPEAHQWLDGGDFAPQSQARGLHMRGRLAMREGNLEVAAQSYAAALKLVPDDSGLWVDLGRLRYVDGQQFGAIAASQRALEIGPDNPAALLFRAQLVRDAQGMRAALPLIERGLEIAPNDPQLLGEYAATLGELGRGKDMVAALRRLAAHDPANQRMFYLQAVLAARAGDYDLARTLLQRSGDLERETPSAILLLGVIDLERGNYASAAQGFDRLSRMQPTNQRVGDLLARSLLMGGNNRELVARFAHDATSPYRAILVGRAYEALGQREDAARYLDLAIRPYAMTTRILPAGVGPEVAPFGNDASGPETVALVRGLLASGQANAARAKAAAFSRRFPESSDALALLGDTELAAGNYASASRHYGEAAKVRRPWPLVKRMAYALIRQNREPAAAALIAEHLSGEPNNAEAAALLARWDFLQRDYRRAGELLDHAAAHGLTTDGQLQALRREAARRARW